MFFIKSHSLLKEFESALQWKQFLFSPAPIGGQGSIGAFVSVPADGLALSPAFLAALRAESRAAFGDRGPRDVHLEGDSLAELPVELLREIYLAVCPSGKSHFGIDLNPARIRPGDIARLRCAGVDRFCLQLFGPCDAIGEIIRRGRALGAYVSAELRLDGFGDEHDLQQVAQQTFSTAPNALCIYDDRLSSLYDNVLLDKLALDGREGGYTQRTLWLWSKSAVSFDRWAGRLSGRYAGLGPCAVNSDARGLRINPPGMQWAESRIDDDFHTFTAQPELRQWISLAKGMYTMRVSRDGLSTNMLTHAAALESMGIIDDRGRPNPARLMDFHHGVARYLTRTLDGRNQQLRLNAAQRQAKLS